MTKYVRKLVTIREDQEETIANHPDLNLSGAVQKMIDGMYPLHGGMPVKQFAAWKAIYDDEPEFADEVLRFMRRPSPDEAMADLIEDTDDEIPIGEKLSPKYGSARECARRIQEMR